MIKYLGSKKRLVPVLACLAESSGAQTALDLFTGTTRVAQAFKRSGLHVTSVDVATYSQVFGQCWIETDASKVDVAEVQAALEHLSALPGIDGYFTETFCVQSRFFQPFNGRRIDAMREELESSFKTSSLYPVLLTSLVLAADRVDSTTGVQMAYLKQWADRSYNELELRVPELIPGTGRSVRGDATVVVGELPTVDLAYLDPPYNQHRYFTNYHIWESLVRWDKPEAYGIAMKRVDSRDEQTKSVFNMKRSMPDALRDVIKGVQCEVLVLSYNNESWLSRDELIAACTERGTVEVLDFDSKRYVGAQIGIFNPSGQRVGEVSHLRNIEHVVIAGPRDTVKRMVEAVEARATQAAPSLFD